MKTHCDVLIIGAGIAGLTAARRLVDAGRDVIVVDKGRGVGGRMATRRFSGATFDHGAQFISVRTEEFGSIMERWLADGVAELWSHGFADGYTGDGSLLTAAADGAA
ncbi:MAG: FAD-dependent oxidoreductase, partial [Spirochaetota bacterium]